MTSLAAGGTVCAWIDGPSQGALTVGFDPGSRLTCLRRLPDDFVVTPLPYID
jgi:hypothetical protein